MNKKVEQYIPLVDFLGAALGVATEIALIDLTTPDHAVVALANGHVSGRTVGDPISNAACSFEQAFADSDQTFISDYVLTSVDGRALQCSVFIIRDEGKLVGLLSVNIDPAPYRQLEDAIFSFMKAYRSGGDEEFRTDNLDVIREIYASSSIETLGSGRVTDVAARVKQIVDAMGTTVDNLDQDGRVTVIRKLEAMGAFNVKGAANDAAGALHISLPTVYRYLQQVRRDA